MAGLVGPALAETLIRAPHPGRDERQKGVRLFQKRMIFRQLLGIPNGEFVLHALLRNLVFRQWLNDLVVDQQSVDEADLLLGRIRRLKHDGTPIHAILHAGENRRLNQFRLMF